MNRAARPDEIRSKKHSDYHRNKKSHGFNTWFRTRADQIFMKKKDNHLFKLITN